MSDFSNYTESKLIDHILRNIAWASPATIYVALFTAVIDAEAGTGTEVAGGSYARQVATFIADTNGLTSNSALITVPTATANWGTITHAGLFDAAAAGNPISVIKAIAAPKIINTGDIFRFPIGSLTFQIL
jgi:hypothetical protein